VAAWSADESYLNRLRAALGKAKGEDHHRMVRSLFQFNDPDLIGRAAQAMLTDEVEPRELYQMKILALTGAARPGLFRFVREHFDALNAKVSEGPTILLQSGWSLCDAESLAAYQQFFVDRAAKMPGGHRRYAPSLHPPPLP